MTPQDFIATILPGALQSQAQNKIPAGFTIAQSALETGWLKVVPPGNNLFGIKADSSWLGAVVHELTNESINGKRVEQNDAFRSYPDYAASIVDHGRFLASNQRYKPCFATTDSIEFAKLVASAGYATDVSYAQTIISIINAHDLTQYDSN